MTACTFPSARFRCESRTGAALSVLAVNSAAALRGRPEYSSARSGLPSARMPAETAPARKPWGLVTPSVETVRVCSLISLGVAHVPAFLRTGNRVAGAPADDY